MCRASAPTSSHTLALAYPLCKHAAPEDDELMRCLFLGIHSGHAYLMRGSLAPRFFEICYAAPQEP